jgi:hypothetical protein
VHVRGALREHSIDVCCQYLHDEKDRHWIGPQKLGRTERQCCVWRSTKSNACILPSYKVTTFRESHDWKCRAEKRARPTREIFEGTSSAGSCSYMASK